MNSTARKFFLFAAVIVFLFPFPAAAETTIPEFNPICWKAKQCCLAQAEMARDSAADGRCDSVAPDNEDEKAVAGWLHDGDCRGQWGKCLPAGVTATQIAFGGKRKFLHIGDLIQTLYVYALRVAAIIATIMIIVAGAQWVTSGGNSETITSAKHRISGALMGLLLAYLSYFILNALNPSLVKLRLPQVYMVRPQKLIPQFCSAASTTLFAFAAGSEEENQKKTPDPLPANFDFNKNGIRYQADPKDLTFFCGKRFYVKDGGERSTCFGDKCESSNTCSNIDLTGKVGNYSCVPARILGTIRNDKIAPTGCLASLVGLAARGWENPEIVDQENELWIVCENGQMHEVEANFQILTRTNDQFYYSRISDTDIDEAINKCGGPEKTKGMVMKLEMNNDCDSRDWDHYVGYDGSNEAVDLGDDVSFKNSDSLTEGAQKIPDRYYLPAEKIRKGLQLNVDAGKIWVIVNSEDRKIYENLWN